MAPDLTPSETAHLDTNHVRAFATESGGRTSHTAIVAGALEIPAVVGIGPFLADVTDGLTVIVDGDHGLVIVDPDEETLSKYQRAEQQRRKFEADLARLKDLPAETRDGVRIALMGNIEFPTEVEHCLARGAEGIGLYRTEFLYLAGDHPPSEEEHFEAYRHVVEAMSGRPVVIRTLDLGADKLVELHEHERERNPFLGQRSIRLCLQHKEIFRIQLRAILRVSVYGDVRIMFPLVSTVHEFRVAKLMVNEVIEDLVEEGISFDRSIPVGMMVEVPSAALLADRFCPVTDFFSIGTNDLTQYTLAVDRNNQTVANLFSPVDPSVLRLIRMSVRAAARRKVPVSVCGEMCAEPAYAVLLIGLGVRNMSVTPHVIPEVKKTIRSITVKDAERYARRALSLETATQVDRYLRAQLRGVIPQAF
jgi:phosphotransferase system enzyme I (PtsI)